MNRNLIVGMGEIGEALKDIFDRDDVQTLDVEEKKITLPIDILHVAFPYSGFFEEEVKKYQKLYKPTVTVVYSTVPIGTCKYLGVFHSPIEGRHPYLKKSIETMTRWIGSNSGSAWPLDVFWREYNRNIKVVESTDFTEFLKLRSTAKYGINLIWTDYEAKVAKKMKMDYALVNEFDTDYNELYEKLGDTWAKRYVLNPPDGKIGGHCIVPNAELLDEQYPSDLLKMIKEMK